ncbi:MAG TPA: glycosyltransferase, partial [Polyangiaceae bacterium]|nr:glycosyltransferase [Polyangiaceae bacterium]
RRFALERAGGRARLVVTDPDEATNPKVAQLLALERAASGAIVVISDSNVRVASGYLEPLVAELARPGVAMVSSVVVGTGEQTLGAALENLQLGALVAPGVVAAEFWTGRAITVGKSMAMWRSRLRRVGGFETVGGVLSEDHMLGRAFAAAGYEVRVSLEPVANRNVACSLARTVERHTRWAKLRRSISPVGFAFEPALSPIVVASLACLASPSKVVAAAFSLAVVLQTLAATIMMRVLRRAAPRGSRGRDFAAAYWVPLEIIRSYVLFFCWLRACVSLRVGWRGHEFELANGSAIVPAEPTIWSRVRTMVRA